jgi:nonribosomal peptide synthetase DhbF
VPSAYVLLESLPLTPNGKVDRKALPALEPTSSQSYVTPRTPLEHILTQIFAETLGVARVGLDDNFFELGGHSLLALQLLRNIRNQLELDIPMRQLFDTPTVSGIVSTPAIAETNNSMFESILPLRKHGSLPALFCLSPGGGLGWMYAPFLRHLHPERPLYALQVEGFLEDRSLPPTIEEAAEHYLSLLFQVQPKGPYYLFGCSFGGLVAHAMATRLQQRQHHVEILGIADTYPADLTACLDIDNYLRDVEAQNSQWSLGLGTAVDKAIVRCLLHSIKLTAAFSPGIYQGDVLLFPSHESVAKDWPARWLPYVSGHIISDAIGSCHSDLLNPEIVAQLGLLLESHLPRP